MASWLRRGLTYSLSWVQAPHGAYMSSDSFLLFRAVSRALMVLNYSHWVMLDSGTGVGN